MTERFYCRYEGGYSQRHLGESREEGENIRLNMASRLDETMREEREKSGREEMTKRERIKKRRQKKRLYS